MIVSDLAHLPTQLKTNSALDQAIEFLRQAGWQGHADGTIPIDGARVYGLLQSHTTRVQPDAVRFEGHYKYIDIQYIIEGEETIFWTPTAGLTPTVPYDDTQDIWFSQVSRQGTIAVALSRGQLVVLFPEDAHAPMYCVVAPSRVRKLVIKVMVSS